MTRLNQSNYDAMNRSLHLYGSLNFQEGLSSELSSLLPVLLGQLNTLEICTGLPVDEPEVSTVLEEIDMLSAGLTVGDIVALEPGVSPQLQSRLDDFRTLGFGFPDEAETVVEAMAREVAIALIVSDANSLKFLDLVFLTDQDISPMAFAAIELGKSTGVLAAAICGNDRSAVTRGVGPYQARIFA